MGKSDLGELTSAKIDPRHWLFGPIVHAYYRPVFVKYNGSCSNTD
jgi:hypothetical protein